MNGTDHKANKGVKEVIFYFEEEKKIPYEAV